MSAQGAAGAGGLLSPSSGLSPGACRVCDRSTHSVVSNGLGGPAPPPDWPGGGDVEQARALVERAPCDTSAPSQLFPFFL